MSDYTIYALKGDEEWRTAVHEPLVQGEGDSGGATWKPPIYAS